jgi:hypothetical protein
MSLALKKIFFELMGDVKFPEGHASNFEHRVENGKLIGLKSHDCHIIMQELLPLAMSRTLPAFVTKPLMGICNYFKLIYSKVVDVKEMQRFEEQIPEIMCQLEMIFPPAFLILWYISLSISPLKLDVLGLCITGQCGGLRGFWARLREWYTVEFTLRERLMKDIYIRGEPKFLF